MNYSNTLDQNIQLKNLTLFKIYTLYRVVLCLALLTTFLLSAEQPLVGGLKPEQFLYVTSSYLVISLFALLLIYPRKTALTNQQVFANVLFDIAIITTIVDASNGVTSGLGILLVVIVASSSIMLTGQIALLCAALATIAIIVDTSLLVSDSYLKNDSFLSAGLLGVILFITSFLIQNLAQRIRGAQRVAEQRAADVTKLQSLNQQIVQRMRTGILVANRQGEIQLANAAASELLGIPTQADADLPKSNHQLQTHLMTQFQQWLRTPQFNSPPFRVSETGPEIHVNFSALSDDDSNQETLIFLEDNRRLIQRAQQIKLASLGRLTASIAHEIRNPLGAISHAAQLMAESQALEEADIRLCNIIQNHSKRMNNVIENVLQLSRRNAPNPETIQLDKWLQHFIDDFETQDLESFDIKLNTLHSCDITIDCSQLTQVITNLAQNGLRYSKLATGHASLTLEVDINPLTQLPILNIIDDGTGIDEQAQEKLFEPFYTTETKGSGLGLYISRELCEANEARLDYIRTKNGKSCFRISFPHPDRRLSPE